MAFNGSGVFTRLYNWVTDAAANIKIRADRMDNEMNGFATGLSTCITKDGQTTITADLPMATFKHTGVGAAASRTDYTRLDQAQDGKLNWVAGGGTSDAITASYAIPLTTLVDGQLCFVRATAANTTTTPTFSPSTLTARTIVKNGGAALAIGDISGAGHELILRYLLASTRWELLNPKGISLSANNTFSGNTTFSGTLTATSTTALTGAVSIAGTSAAQASISLAEDTDNGTNKVTIQPPATLAADYTLTLPADDGSANQYLKTDGSGVLGWATLAADVIVDMAYAEYLTNTDITTAIPFDDTIPQVGEGTQILSVSITPKTITNRIILRFSGTGCTAGNNMVIYAIFANGASNAIAAGASYNATSAVETPCVLETELVPGSTSAQTYTVRVGPDTGTLRMNGNSSARRFGGVAKCVLIAEEITA